ncbi:RNA-binding transcriptional accessory protein [Rhizobium sp. KVB221]|uniref:Small ribosomal subunit protein bS1 n=1 Tax=Rhizobium setariae TaxID=2801340 RepID=A0A936YN31_9HYPH|nr:Tex family protein [Rhizobium setariae]MBL0371164.1 RNA-binding transcriptional accessory protein [Rhizobium setariae]
MPADMNRLAAIIAAEINARPAQVTAAVGLIDEGATIPFIARYRKEVTDGLDDTQLRNLSERLVYLREMEARRDTILDSIVGQGKMTDELKAKILQADTKSVLEDIYLPYKPKRRTRAQIARERGLQGLSDAILANRQASPQTLAEGFVKDEVADVKAALEGARDIIAEDLSENAELLGRLRTHMHGRSQLVAKVADEKKENAQKFSDYFDHKESWSKVPGHRALAMLRGWNEEVLSVTIETDADDPSPVKPAETIVAAALDTRTSGAGDTWLRDVAGWAWRVKLNSSLSLELIRDMKERAEEEAIRVFARNLKDLLLAAPAGMRTAIGLDPGIRTGVKVAVVDQTGKLLDTATVYPFQPRNDLIGAQAEIASLIRKHKVDLIAIGNGTASRETEKLAADLIEKLPAPKPVKVIVSEAGASVYSASELAAKEFPQLDVSLRGAVSIARRLQDPLAELVKIEPKSIGVGQYQHDVDQGKLGRSLDGVVEDAVNAVGVDLNTASAPLLARVSGLNTTLATQIVTYRDENGAFKSRQELLKVPRLGARTFEQCAGFLRISNGKEPLDASSVHPEAYGVARKIINACGRDLRALMGDSSALKGIDPRQFIDEKFGLPTVKDIISELEKPGRDPRPEFKTATFAEGVNEISDLRPGMMLEGTVTNVAAFGAFVDIGVHQDGLVHVSELADKFVKDPHEIVKAGDIVKVRVVEVDAKRKRIALSMKKESSGPREPREDRNRNSAPAFKQSPKPQAPSQGAFGAALMEAMKKK